MEYTDFLIRITAALILSFLIGLERQWRRRAVGLRTNVLVCLGAFLFVSMSFMIKGAEFDFKVAAQVISGIGFLGAGVILKDGLNIRGLNTAATLWCSAAIGVLCASGLLIEAATGTFFVLLSNIVLRAITRKLIKKEMEKKEQSYNLKIVCDKEKEMILRTMLIQNINDENIALDNLDTFSNEGRVSINLHVTLSEKDNASLERIITRFTMEPGVVHVGYKKEEYELDEDS